MTDTLQKFALLPVALSRQEELKHAVWPYVVFNNNLTSPVPLLRELNLFRSVKQETTNSGQYFEVVTVEMYGEQHRSF
jgi:hypothetical protein